jgi:rhodanese-related sulfurtransferase
LYEDKEMMKTLISRRLAIAVLAAASMAPAWSQADNDSVTLDSARKELEAGRVLLFDVREPQEHATGVIKGAHLLPMRQLGARINEIPNDPAKPVLLICHSQNRSSATFKILRERGYTNVRFVQGGMGEWNRRGWPVVKPEQASSSN